MTTRLSNLGPLVDSSAIADNNGPLTVQRKSNDLVMTDGNRNSNSSPLSDTTARITNDGPMTTA